jgi:hypothetical protein
MFYPLQKELLMFYNIGVLLNEPEFSFYESENSEESETNQISTF